MRFMGPRGVRAIVRRLEKTYGPRPWRRQRAGIDGLVRTILSQNTSDANARAAFASLKKRFPTWELLIEARTAAVEQAIRSGGLSRIKAPRIKAALRSVKRRQGRLSLDFLESMPLADAKAYLRHLGGVGPKTACCVLMFCYNRPAFPVDTHVHRTARRLGLVPQRCSPEAAHELLERICPPELVYAFHVLMVEHGRRVCRARKPACGPCSLADRCPARNRLRTCVADQ